MVSRTASIRHELTTTGDVPIHIAIHDGDGPALVLIHGISGTGDVWLPVIPQLASVVTPVTIDLRGHGRSGKPDSGYLYDDYLGDLDRVLETLGLARPLIMGHSLGGLVTLWWAATQPDRAAALVIEDSPLRSGEDFREAFDGWIHLNGLPVDAVEAHYADRYPHWKPEAVQARAASMVTTAPAVFTELKADSLANHGVDRIAEIEQVESPALLIHGDLDSGGMVHPDDAAGFEARLANAEAARIAGGSHALHIDRTREFLALALPFIERHRERASHIAGHVYEG